MNRSEANNILDQAQADILILEEEGAALIEGKVTVEELHAILHHLEYTK